MSSKVMGLGLLAWRCSWVVMGAARPRTRSCASPQGVCFTLSFAAAAGVSTRVCSDVGSLKDYGNASCFRNAGFKQIIIIITRCSFLSI